MSFASAPRSPTWFARRSSSSAMPRSACARGVFWHLASASTTWQYARGVSDGGVARQRLRVVDRALVGPAEQRLLDAAVLIAERDLEMEDVLAVALEAEVPGLDDPGVDGADGHLVHLVALDAVEVRHADQRRLRRRARRRPRSRADRIGGSEPA